MVRTHGSTAVLLAFRHSAWARLQTAFPHTAHAGGSTFGIRTYGSSSYQATGASGAYKVDTLTNKPAYSAFKSAL